MTTITAKLDDETVRALDEIAQGVSRSEIIREALREYIATWKLEQRRKQVVEYMQRPGNREEISRLAELDMDHAAELLDRSETK